MAGMGSPLSGEDGQAIGTPSEPVQVRGMASTLFPKQSGWLRLEVGTIFSLDEYPLLQAPATGSPAITLWVSALLTELFWMGEPLLLAPGS